MNTTPQISSYEIKVARTGLRVPVINGIHLHSIYNPEKEAESFITANLEAIKKRNEIIILGLGFAYHVNLVNDMMTKIHGDDFKIIVIEPNRHVHEDCLILNLLNEKNTLVYSNFSVNSLYRDIDLIHFLLRKPAIITHSSSFNLYQDYFRNFLTFEAPTQLKAIIDFVGIEEVKTYLETFDESLSFDEILYEVIPKKKSYSTMDFLSMALMEMSGPGARKNLKEGEP